EHSLAKGILDAVSQKLLSDKIAYSTIDLYKDEFCATYSKEELAGYSNGTVTDPLVLNYQKRILDCEEIILITPIWWNDVPAMVKGFFDRVFTKGFAYRDGKRGVVGNLGHIKKVTVITTSNSPTWYLKYRCGNPIRNIIIKSTLKQVGITNAKCLNLGQVKSADKESFLNKVKHNIV
ncbi:MAG: flavodoxin family protein, partial [Erysipelothrix sp.]|nr:flavodoxin family protein [Erysipelothrix sp.]